MTPKEKERELRQLKHIGEPEAEEEREAAAAMEASMAAEDARDAD